MAKMFPLNVNERWIPAALTPASFLQHASSHLPTALILPLIKKQQKKKKKGISAKLRADRVSMATASQRSYFSAVCNFDIRCNHARLDAAK